MALTWSIEKVRDHDSLCRTDESGQRYLNGVTETLIYATAITGIPRITEKTAPELAARLELVQALGPPLLVGPDGPERVTADHVVRHIGLSTNAQSETRAAWVKRITQDTLALGSRAAHRALKAAQEPVPG